MPSKYYISSMPKSKATKKTKDCTGMNQTITFIATKVRIEECGLDNRQW